MRMTFSRQDEAGASVVKRNPKAQIRKTEDEGGDGKPVKKSAKTSSKRKRKGEEYGDEGKRSSTNTESGIGGEQSKGGKEGGKAKKTSPGKEKDDSGGGVGKSKKGEGDAKENKRSAGKKGAGGKGGDAEGEKGRKKKDSKGKNPGTVKAGPSKKMGEAPEAVVGDDSKRKKGGRAKAKKEGGGGGDRRPKRPLNGYFLFSNDVRPGIKEKNPGASTAEIMAKIGEAFRDLDDDAKRRYSEAAAAARMKFLEEHGDRAFLQKRAKKEKQRRNVSGGGVGAEGQGSEGAPAEPAKGLPDGWTIRRIPRKAGHRSDPVWLSPAECYRFRSLKEAKRFQEILEEAGGDEVAAMKLHTEKEK